MRPFAAFLSAAYLLTNAVFLHAAESNFWAERRRAARPAAQDTLLASLPAGPRQTDAGMILQNVQVTSVPPVSVSLPIHIQETLSRDFKGEHGDLIAALPMAHSQIRRISETSRKDAPVILHIQDVHENLEAQTNIALALQDLFNKGVVDAVALEGAFDPFNLRRFRNFPYRDAMSEAADYLLRENRISGPIRAALSSPVPIPPFVGIDDPGHYHANVDAYRRSAPRQDSVRKELDALRGAVDAEKARVFSPGLLAFDRQAEAYHRGALSLGDYAALVAREGQGPGKDLTAFLEALALEKSLDFARVERERKQVFDGLMRRLREDDVRALVQQSLAYRAGRIGYGDFYRYLSGLCVRQGVSLSNTPAMETYVRYVLISDGIRSENLMAQLAAAESRAYGRLAATPAERDLLVRAKRLSLTSKLLDFSLTPQEWEEYKKIAKSGSGVVAPFMGQSSGRDHSNAPDESGDYRGDLSSFEDFYEEAEARNEDMVENLMNNVASGSWRVSGTTQSPSTGHKPPVIVLIAGGFHSAGLEELMRARGATFVTLAPKVTKADGLSGSAYLSVFAREKTPIEKLFEGEKLFVAKHPMEKAVAGWELPFAAALFKNRSHPNGFSIPNVLQMLAQVPGGIRGTVVKFGKREVMIRMILNSGGAFVSRFDIQEGRISSAQPTHDIPSPAASAPFLILGLSALTSVMPVVSAFDPANLFIWGDVLINGAQSWWAIGAIISGILYLSLLGFDRVFLRKAQAINKKIPRFMRQYYPKKDELPTKLEDQLETGSNVFKNISIISMLVFLAGAYSIGYLSYITQFLLSPTGRLLFLPMPSWVGVFLTIVPPLIIFYLTVNNIRKIDGFLGLGWVIGKWWIPFAVIPSVLWMPEPWIAAIVVVWVLMAEFFLNSLPQIYDKWGNKEILASALIEEIANRGIVFPLQIISMTNLVVELSGVSSPVVFLIGVCLALLIQTGGFVLGHANQIKDKGTFRRYFQKTLVLSLIFISSFTLLTSLGMPIWLGYLIGLAMSTLKHYQTNRASASVQKWLAEKKHRHVTGDYGSYHFGDMVNVLLRALRVTHSWRSLTPADLVGLVPDPGPVHEALGRLASLIDEFNERKLWRYDNVAKLVEDFFDGFRYELRQFLVYRAAEEGVLGFPAEKKDYLRERLLSLYPGAELEDVPGRSSEREWVVSFARGPTEAPVTLRIRISHELSLIVDPSSHSPAQNRLVDAESPVNVIFQDILFRPAFGPDAGDIVIAHEIEEIFAKRDGLDDEKAHRHALSTAPEEAEWIVLEALTRALSAEEIFLGLRFWIHRGNLEPMISALARVLTAEEFDTLQTLVTDPDGPGFTAFQTITRARFEDFMMEAGWMPGVEESPEMQKLAFTILLEYLDQATRIEWLGKNFSPEELLVLERMLYDHRSSNGRSVWADELDELTSDLYQDQNPFKDLTSWINSLSERRVNLLGEGWHSIGWSTNINGLPVSLKYVKSPSAFYPLEYHENDWSRDHSVIEGELQPVVWEYIRLFESYGALAPIAKVLISRDAFEDLSVGQKEKINRYIQIGIVEVIGQPLIFHPKLESMKVEDVRKFNNLQGVNVSVAILEPEVITAIDEIQEAARNNNNNTLENLLGRYLRFVGTLWERGVFDSDASISNSGIWEWNKRRRFVLFDVLYRFLNFDTLHPSETDLSGKGTRPWIESLMIHKGVNDYAVRTALSAGDWEITEGVYRVFREQTDAFFNTENFFSLWTGKRPPVNLSSTMLAQRERLLGHPLTQLIIDVMRGGQESSLRIETNRQTVDVSMSAGLRMWTDNEGKSHPLIVAVNPGRSYYDKAWGKIYFDPKIADQMGIRPDSRINYRLVDLLTGERIFRNGKELREKGLDIGLPSYAAHAFIIEDVEVVALEDGRFSIVEKIPEVESHYARLIQSTIPPVTAIGDIHGQYELFVRALEAAEYIKRENGRIVWTGGDRTLLLTGDVGHGPQLKEVYELIMDLAGQAAQAGGKIVWLLGNHDMFIDGQGGGPGHFGYDIWLDVREIALNPIPGLEIKLAHADNGRVYVHGGVLPNTWQDALIEMGGDEISAEDQAKWINRHFRVVLEKNNRLTADTLSSYDPILNLGTAHRGAHDTVLPGNSGYVEGGVVTADWTELDFARHHLPKAWQEMSPQAGGHSRDTRAGIGVTPDGKFIFMDVGRDRGVDPSLNGVVQFIDGAWIARYPDGRMEVLSLTPDKRAEFLRKLEEKGRIIPPDSRATIPALIWLAERLGGEAGARWYIRNAWWVENGLLAVAATALAVPVLIGSLPLSLALAVAAVVVALFAGSHAFMKEAAAKYGVKPGWGKIAAVSILLLAALGLTIYAADQFRQAAEWAVPAAGAAAAWVLGFAGHKAMNGKRDGKDVISGYERINDSNTSRQNLDRFSESPSLFAPLISIVIVYAVGALYFHPMIGFMAAAVTILIWWDKLFPGSGLRLVLNSVTHAPAKRGGESVVPRLSNMINGAMSENEFDSRFENFQSSIEKYISFYGRKSRKRIDVQLDITQEPIFFETTNSRFGSAFPSDVFVMEIISNAFKYTDEGGTIIIRLGFDGNAVVFQVENTGIGFSDDESQRLGQPFYRGRKTHGEEGFGLGLRTVEDFVNKVYGGNFAIESDGEGQGATVTITLPWSDQDIKGYRQPSTVIRAIDRRATIPALIWLAERLGGEAGARWYIRNAWWVENGLLAVAATALAVPVLIGSLSLSLALAVAAVVVALFAGSHAFMKEAAAKYGVKPGWGKIAAVSILLLAALGLTIYAADQFRQAADGVIVLLTALAAGWAWIGGIIAHKYMNGNKDKISVQAAGRQSALAVIRVQKLVERMNSPKGMTEEERVVLSGELSALLKDLPLALGLERLEADDNALMLVNDYVSHVMLPGEREVFQDTLRRQIGKEYPGLSPARAALLMGNAVVEADGGKKKGTEVLAGETVENNYLIVNPAWQEGAGDASLRRAIRMAQSAGDADFHFWVADQRSYDLVMKTVRSVTGGPVPARWRVEVKGSLIRAGDGQIPAVNLTALRDELSGEKTRPRVFVSSGMELDDAGLSKDEAAEIIKSVSLWILNELMNAMPVRARSGDIRDWIRGYNLILQSA